MSKYIPANLEKKWQDKWQEDGQFLTNLKTSAKKYYVLVELAYSSGDLHMGHWFTFSYGDILARFKKMQGFNAILPNGFDAFGLPAENAAIKRNIHPSDWTYSNIERMKQQFATLGAMFDWSHSTISCDPKYYKWNQWIFLKLLEKGLAYKGKVLSNWCPSCMTVLANENVEAGKCWRCGTEVEQKEIEQWFFKITDYADKLLWTDENADIDWPKPLKIAQNDWIGKKVGINITYNITDSKETVTVFTTRPDTNFGATFIAIAPEHELVKKITTPEQKGEVEAYIKEVSKKSELERKELKEKTGVFTGSYALNPLTESKLPIWVSDFVLPGFGTGALVGVPGHDKRDFEFANKFGLEVVRVVVGTDNDDSPITSIDQVQEEEGTMINSGFLDGMDIHKATEKIMDYMEEKGYGKKNTEYHLHDWSIGRQRYWGTPIPVVYCDDCGMVPVPEKNLPVELPYDVDYQPKGKAPLATAEDWVNTECPKCGKKAKRETETLDGFMDNSWYFFRYLDPQNDSEIFDKEIINNWMPLDIYIGGAEHTFGHALYSRFFTKFFHDLGLIKFDEYSKRRLHHGIILGPDGAKMSKSKGNVINPDEQVSQFGADAVRVYLSFLGPIDIVTAWKPEGINGIYHFMQRVWGLYDKVADVDPDANDLHAMHKSIQKVTADLEELKNNTAIASLMEWLNHLSRKDQVSKVEFETYIKLLAPLAPHITEELWYMLGNSDSIHLQKWPEVDEKYLEKEEVTVVVQINGKVRDTVIFSKEAAEDKSIVENHIMELEKIQKYLDGKEIVKTIYVPNKIFSIVTN